MGRRPNAIVSEYFLRGEKLADASNRYAHTCRRCGQLFPKGRVDNLVNHLLQQCQSVTQEDRDYVYHCLQPPTVDDPEPTLETSGALPRQPSLVERSNSQEFSSQSSPPQREQSALETLAEASRTHAQPLLNNEDSRSIPREASTDSRSASFAEQLRVAASSSPSPAKVPLVNYEVPLSDTQVIPSRSPLHKHETLSRLPHFEHTVSVVGQQLEQPSEQQPSETIDLRLTESSSAMQIDNHTAPETRTTIVDSDAMSWTPTATSNKFGTFSTILSLSNGQTPSFGLLHKHGKSKARGRFTDVRRKEVQEIRKRGACIRCRMLKKSCSEGTPCNQCKSVETARLWKVSCLRTKLVDEFTLWSTGLYYSKARTEISSSVYGLEQLPLTGRLEIRFFTSAEVYITFAARTFVKGLHSNPSWVSDDGMEQSSLNNSGTSETIWVLDEGGGIGAKFQAYVEQVTDVCIDQERSPFLKATLQRARAMAPTEETEVPTADIQAPRSCYNLQSSQLLKPVVELWAHTAILACRGQKLHVHYNRMKEPQRLPVNGPPADTDLSEHLIPQRSQDLILAQLLAAAESRCSVLSKMVLNELERRLLQRQQVSRFSTFISAVILLNCIERMTDIFRDFDDTPESQDAGDSTPFRPLNWPLDAAPSKYWPQGEHFTELLNMLLRMRALPPQTVAVADGKLVVDKDSAGQSYGRPIKVQADEQAALLASWLDPMELQMADLRATRDREMPGPRAGAEAWDLRFISRLLVS